MKLRYIVFGLVVALVAGGGIYFYHQTFNKKQAEVWAFIPQNAVFVFETNSVYAFQDDLPEKPIGNIVGHLPWYRRVSQHFNQLDSSSQNLESFFKNRKAHASLHITGNNSFDYLFYLPIKGVKDYNTLKEVIDSFRKNNAFAFSKRTFHGFEFQEFTNRSTREVISFFVKDNFLIGSQTPFLVEDVVRQYESIEKSGSFRGNNPGLFNVSHVEEGLGRIYVNGARLGAFLNLFVRDTHFKPLYPVTSKLDFVLNDDGLLLNGYSILEKGESEPYLQSLLFEKPQNIGWISQMLPLRTSYLYFFGFEDGAQWHRKLTGHREDKGWQNLAKEYPETGEFISLLANRLALAGIPKPGDKTNLLLYLQTKDGKKAAETLSGIASRMGLSTGDSLFQEAFGGKKIYQLPYKELPESIFGPAFSGFNECFFLEHGNYIVMSNSIQELKSMLLDMETENTWHKSVNSNQFLSKINQEVNFGLYVNTEAIWKNLLTEADPEWQQLLESQGQYLRQLNMMALQFSSLDDIFYTNLLLQANPKDIKQLQQLRLSTVHETILNAPAVTKPAFVKDNARKTVGLFVQDSAKFLYLLDPQGDIVNKDSLGATIIGEIYPLTDSQNKVPKALVVTGQRFFLYNSSLKREADFQLKSVDSHEVEWANLIDYDGSKNYRLIVADRSGDIFMYDLKGNNLEGWTPRNIGGSLSFPPGHVRVRGRDCIYAFEKGGIIHLMNRRGESYKGFPLNLKGKLNGQAILKGGSDFKTTIFTTITSGGEIISFNLEGKITHQSQLFKPDAASTFQLVNGHSATGYLIVRKSANRMGILDDKGNLLFEKDYLGASNSMVQYFDFGADKEIISVTDPEEEFTFLYDRSGNLLNYEPLNSCCPLSIQFDEASGGYNIYKAYEEKVTLLKSTN